MATTNEIIEALLMRLPVLEEQRGNIPIVALRLAIQTIATVNELPRAQRAGTRQAVAELQHFAKLAKALRELCRSMHRDALEALEAHQGKARDPHLIADDMLHVIAAAGTALDRLKAGPIEPAPEGRPVKHGAAAIAKAAASAYEQLTGKPPTVPAKDGKAYGPFLDFIEGLFDALKIRASPEAWARAAVKEKRPPKKVG